MSSALPAKLFINTSKSQFPPKGGRQSESFRGASPQEKWATSSQWIYIHRPSTNGRPGRWSGAVASMTSMRIANPVKCPLAGRVFQFSCFAGYGRARLGGRYQTQKMPLNETATASPTLTADSMIQPTNTDRGPRRNMTPSTSDLNDLSSQSSQSRSHVGIVGAESRPR